MAVSERGMMNRAGAAPVLQPFGGVFDFQECVHRAKVRSALGQDIALRGDQAIRTAGGRGSEAQQSGRACTKARVKGSAATMQAAEVLTAAQNDLLFAGHCVQIEFA